MNKVSVKISKERRRNIKRETPKYRKRDSEISEERGQNIRRGRPKYQKREAMDDAESSASLLSKSEFERDFLPDNDTNLVSDHDLASDQYGDAPYPDLSQIPAICTGFIIIYGGVFIISLFGNAAVCFTVISNRKMQTVVNCYIVNLALCDLMVGTFVLPVKLLELTAPARWGALNDGLCTLMLYLQTVFVFASVLTLVATCIER